MKKLAVMPAVCLLMMSFAGIAFAKSNSGFQYGDFRDGVMIVKYEPGAMEAVAPSRLDGKQGVAIGGTAFKDKVKVEKVQLPESVTRIEEGAFSGCADLVRINIPAAVEEITGNPFPGCARLKYIDLAPKNPLFATIDGMLFRKAD